VNALTLTAALLLGLAASGHCVVMCGGISSALSLATARNANGRPRPALLFGYQLGRIASYTLAGLLFGGVLGGVIRLLDIESVRATLRAFSALALLFAALVMLGRVRDPGLGVGRQWWSKLAPLGRRLLPVATLPRAFAFGTLWGWMPCGFVYTVLVMASLQFDAVRGALTMAAFGLGTAPALFAAALGAPRLAAVTARPGARQAAGSILLVSAVLTFAGPWLVHAMPGLAGLLPFDC
jgi:sulfite exporter TauE/SafE